MRLKGGRPWSLGLVSEKVPKRMRNSQPLFGPTAHLGLGLVGGQSQPGFERRARGIARTGPGMLLAAGVNCAAQLRRTGQAGIGEQRLAALRPQLTQFLVPSLGAEVARPADDDEIGAGKAARPFAQLLDGKGIGQCFVAPGQLVVGVEIHQYLEVARGLGRRNRRRRPARIGGRAPLNGHGGERSRRGRHGRAGEGCVRTAGYELSLVLEREKVVGRFDCAHIYRA